MDVGLRPRTRPTSTTSGGEGRRRALVVNAFMICKINMHRYPKCLRFPCLCTGGFRHLWEPSFSILFSPQESVQVDLWSLCDLWSAVRRKKRHAAQLGSGSVFPCRRQKLVDNQWPSEIGNIVIYPFGVCHSATPPRGGTWLGVISATTSNWVACSI